MKGAGREQRHKGREISQKDAACNPGQKGNALRSTQPSGSHRVCTYTPTMNEQKTSQMCESLFLDVGPQATQGCDPWEGNK